MNEMERIWKEVVAAQSVLFRIQVQEVNAKLETQSEITYEMFM
jgi:hypothetical protein